MPTPPNARDLIAMCLAAALDAGAAGAQTGHKIAFLPDQADLQRLATHPRLGECRAVADVLVAYTSANTERSATETIDDFVALTGKVHQGVTGGLEGVASLLGMFGGPKKPARKAIR